MTEHLEHLWPDPDRREGAVHWIIRDVLNAHEPRTEVMPSELRVLQASSFGLPADGVGSVLGLQTYTVRDQLKSARRALRAKNTTHACCEALRQGLIR